MMRFRFLALATGLTALPLAILVANAQGTPGGLKPASAFQSIADRDTRSAALFIEMGKVLQHPRCVNCHPRTDKPLQTDAGIPHRQLVVRGKDDEGATGMECEVCHGPTNVAFSNGTGSIPGHPLWHLAPIEMAWEGKSLRQICEQLKDRRRNSGKTLAQIVEHNEKDTLVGWGWNPGVGRTPAPGTQAEFGALSRAWVESGAKCPA